MSEILEIEGIDCNVLTLEGLIITKKAAGRKKDLNLIPELEALLALNKSK
jgi:predicted nucleotidyltransferase